MNQLKANREMIEIFATRTKCWMCKHKFEKPLILPVKTPEHGKYQPNYNFEVLFHLQGTHGIPKEAVIRMVSNSIYDVKNTMQSVYGETL